MQEINLGSAISLTAPANTTNVVVQHEWGDLEVGFASASAGVYTYTPNSIGKYTIYFVKNYSYSTAVAQPYPNFVNHPTTTVVNGVLTVQIVTASGSTLTTGTYTATVLQRNVVNVVTPLVTASDFFGTYSNLDNSTNESNFAFTERIIRKYVQRHCQQDFGPYINKSRVIQGEGKDDLPLPYSLLALNDIADSFGNDLTIYVDTDFVSPWFIHHRPDVLFVDSSVDYSFIDRKSDVTIRGYDFFSKKLNYTVTADWGFYDVPNDVIDACKLLIADTYTGISALIRAGIDQAQLGDYSFRVNPMMAGSTGNLLADELLSNYVLINIGLA